MTRNEYKTHARTLRQLSRLRQIRDESRIGRRALMCERMRPHVVRDVVLLVEEGWSLGIDHYMRAYPYDARVPYAIERDVEHAVDWLDGPAHFYFEAPTQSDLAFYDHLQRMDAS